MPPCMTREAFLFLRIFLDIKGFDIFNILYILLLSRLVERFAFYQGRDVFCRRRKCRNLFKKPVLLHVLTITERGMFLWTQLRSWRNGRKKMDGMLP